MTGTAKAFPSKQILIWMAERNLSFQVDRRPARKCGDVKRPTKGELL